MARARTVIWLLVGLVFALVSWLFTAPVASAQIKGDPTPPTATSTVGLPATQTPTIVIVVTVALPPSMTPTATHSSTAIAIMTAVSAGTPTGTPPAAGPSPSSTPAPATASATATQTLTPPAATLTPTSTATGTVTPTVTGTVTPTATPSVTITATPTPTWLPPGPECYVKPGKPALKLNVPYIHQVNDINNVDGNWACGPTSVAMVLAYYGKLEPWQTYEAQHAAGGSQTPGTPSATPTRTPVRVTSLSDRVDTGSSFAPYVTNQYTYNGHTYSATGPDPHGKQVAGLYGTIAPAGLADWGRISQVLVWHGLSSRQIPASWDSVVGALKRGHPVIIGNGLTPLGHVLVAIGYAGNNELIVNDPYGNRFAAGYGANDGGGMYYLWSCMRVHNALEVIGVYPPPTATVTATATATAPASLVGVVSLPSDRDALPAPSLLNGHAPQKTAEALSEEFSGVNDASPQKNGPGESAANQAGGAGNRRASSADFGSRRAAASNSGTSPWLLPALLLFAGVFCTVVPVGLRRSARLRAARVSVSPQPPAPDER